MDARGNAPGRAEGRKKTRKGRRTVMEMHPEEIFSFPPQK